MLNMMYFRAYIGTSKAPTTLTIVQVSVGRLVVGWFIVETPASKSGGGSSWQKCVI